MVVVVVLAVVQREGKMAQAVAMAGLCSSLSSADGASRLLVSSPSSSSPSKPALRLPLARASSSDPVEDASAKSSSRRQILSLVAAASALLVSKQALADPSPIKLFGPPPPSGGLPGTENSDEARDLDLPLKNRFYLQPLPPVEAIARAKESAKEIVGVKALIDKKAWPYVQNGLRSQASYLRFDLNTVIASKPKEEKKALKSLSTKLFNTINNLDYAARSKSTTQAEKYYGETVSALNDVLAKLG